MGVHESYTRRRPYSVVLFDEIEKAHPDVWNTLLQVLDDGRLTDAQGRTVDFKNAVVVLTSNIGSRHTLDDKPAEAIKKEVMDEVRVHFRPELLNRLDEIVVFQRLGQQEIRKVVDLQIERFVKRLHEREIGLEITDAAKDWIGEVGYDPTYGARPLKRAIQRHLENRLAEDLLAGRYVAGDTIIVDRAPRASPGLRPGADDGELVFRKRASDGKTTGATRVEA